MGDAVFKCDECGGANSAELINLSAFVTCRFCQKEIQKTVFPAFFRSLEIGLSSEQILTDSEAGCFFHSEKKASVACDGCGRFLCALCDIAVGEDHLCSPCIESGRNKGKIKTMENKRTRHDKVALSLAVLPLLLWPFTVITAPAALYTSIRYRKSPPSLVSPSRWRFSVAGILAVLQMIAWLVLFVYLITEQGWL